MPRRACVCVCVCVCAPGRIASVLVRSPLVPALNAADATWQEEVKAVLAGPDGILTADEKGADWYFRQENEWALAHVLDQVTKVQSQIRGALHRKRGGGAYMA